MADEPKLIERVLFNGFTTIVGLSLSLNSFFVKDKINEISDNIARMATSIHSLEVATAVVKQQIDFQAREIVDLRYEISQLKRQIKGQ